MIYFFKKIKNELESSTKSGIRLPSSSSSNSLQAEAETDDEAFGDQSNKS